MFRLTRLSIAVAGFSLLAACAGVPSPRALQEVRSQQNPVDKLWRVPKPPA